MSDIKSSRPEFDREAALKAAGEGGQAKPPKANQQAHKADDNAASDAASEAVKNLETTIEDYQTFQDGLRQTVQEMVLDAQATGRMLAEVEYSLPKVMGEAYRARRRQLGGEHRLGGGSQGAFPSPPAFRPGDSLSKGLTLPAIPGSALALSGGGSDEAP